MPCVATIEAFWQVCGRFHPLLVHFPIALILLAAGLEVFWYVMGRRDQASPTAGVCLWFGLLGGGVALWAGWMLAQSGGEVGRLLTLHRWTAVAAVGVTGLAAIGWLLRRWRGRDWAAPHLAFTVVAAVLVVISAHFGGEMAWGSDWVFAPLRASDRGWSSVEPILSTHCQKCHGGKRQKGDLRLVPWRKMFECDPADWVVRPGDAAASTLHTLITKPADDEDIMPPAEKGEPLSETQIQTIVDWINAGALGPDGQVPSTVAELPGKPAT
ncbi:MAG TPA: hypothetical protein DEO92_08960 [Phycisphaerales bacterium]|nr:hypothetical protein [Phycisphaerales bacterium]